MCKKESNIKGKIVTGATTAGVITILAVASFFSNKDTEKKNENVTTETMNIEDDTISLKDTKNYKVMKVKSGDYKRINNMWNNSKIKYCIVKEVLFPSYNTDNTEKNTNIKNLYALVDIHKNETILYRNKEGKVIDEDYDLECIELGSLADYLVKYDYIKEKYNVSELQSNIIERLEKENLKNEKIDFYDTTQYDILELQNEETSECSYHIVKKWPNHIGMNNEVYFNSIYEDVSNGKDILEVDEFGDVIDKYKEYSYNVLGSLTDYLVTYNAVKPEYDTEEFKNILDRVVQENKPVEKIK
ncbi:MAG: hypothetical protein HFJ12_05390 [Bacilli bacterium]|nr:hypothetical protein [Bacilli bacterium]